PRLTPPAPRRWPERASSMSRSASGSDTSPSYRSELPGLLVLTFCTFIAVTTEMAPIGLLPAIGADLGIDEGRTGMLVSIYALLVVALAVPLTFVLRRLPGKWVLFATMLGYLAANVVFALAPGFGTLAVGRMIGGATH